MALSCCSFFHAGNLFWIWFYHPIQNPCALYALHCPVSQQSYAAICQPGRKEHQCSREKKNIYIRALYHLQAACTHFDLYSHSLPVFFVMQRGSEVSPRSGQSQQMREQQTMGALGRSAYPTSVYQSLIKPRQLLLQRWQGTESTITAV